MYTGPEPDMASDRSVIWNGELAVPEPDHSNRSAISRSSSSLLMRRAESLQERASTRPLPPPAPERWYAQHTS